MASSYTIPLQSSEPTERLSGNAAIILHEFHRSQGSQAPRIVEKSPAFRRHGKKSASTRGSLHTCLALLKRADTSFQLMTFQKFFTYSARLF